VQAARFGGGAALDPAKAVKMALGRRKSEGVQAARFGGGAAHSRGGAASRSGGGAASRSGGGRLVTSAVI
jgi:hypothetical protein